MIFHFSGTTGASLFTAIRESINFHGAFASISRYPNEIQRAGRRKVLDAHRSSKKVMQQQAEEQGCRTARSAK